MNEQFVIEFIHRRMAQMGVSSYHMEPLLLLSKKIPGLTFNVQNEYWYLVGWTQNVAIVSDTAAYQYSSSLVTQTSTPEFTGEIKIVSGTDNIPLHFIRVIIQQA